MDNLSNYEDILLRLALWLFWLYWLYLALLCFTSSGFIFTSSGFMVLFYFVWLFGFIVALSGFMVMDNSEFSHLFHLVLSDAPLDQVSLVP